MMLRFVFDVKCENYIWTSAKVVDSIPGLEILPLGKNSLMYSKINKI